MKSGHGKAEEARRKAHAQFNKPKGHDAKGLSDYEKAKLATAAKTARLRAQRLEKEAADRDLAAQVVAAGGKPPKATKASRATAADEAEEDDAEGSEPEIGAEPEFGADTEREPESRFIDD